MRSLAECPVGVLVAERLARSRVLDRFGIDYCCGGGQTLETACRDRQLSLAEVEKALLNDGEAAPGDGPDWRSEPLAALIRNIVEGHHSYLREELPRLGAMLEKVLDRHGPENPWLRDLSRTFLSLWDELFDHMRKEEVVLFPYVQRLEEAARSGQPAPRFHCGTVLQPIHVMEEEHRLAGAALARIRELTNDFQPPENACTTWRALWDGLEGLERDLHLHIHKENNILFPRAIELERQPLGAACR